MHVLTVEKPSVITQLLLDIRSSTLGKNLMNVMTVGKLLATAQTSFSIRGHIPERRPTNAGSVGAPLVTV